MEKLIAFNRDEFRVMIVMQRVFVRFAFGLAMLLLASTQAFALTVTMNAKTENGDKPVVVGSTNLPDGIELMISITRKENQFHAQTKSKIVGGAFRSEQFSDKGTPMSPGVYTLEISMAVAMRQPSSVLPVIGDRGSKLQGPLVKNSGISELGKYVEYKTSFKIGSGQSSAEKDKLARAQDAKDKRAWKLQACKDGCAITQGAAKKRNELFDYDQCYKACSADEVKKN